MDISKLNFPKIEKYNLDNGLSVFWLPRKEINHIHVEAVIKSGSREEPNRLSGISHFLEHLILYSTTDSFPTLKEISDFSSKVGGFVNASTYYNSIVLYGDFPIKNLSKALLLLKERLFNLKFNSKTFKAERARIIQEIKSDKDDIMVELKKLLIQNQVKEKDSAFRDVLGRIESVKDMKIVDVKKYYNKIVNPLNTVLIVSGASSLKGEGKNQIVSKWGKVKNKVRSFPNIRKTSFVNFSKKYYTRDNLEETYFSLSFPLEDFSYKQDEKKLKLLHYILDFNEDSIIQNIEKQGLAYHLAGEYVVLPNKLLYYFYGHTENMAKFKKIKAYIKKNLIENSSKSLTSSLFEKAKDKALFFNLV